MVKWYTPQEKPTPATATIIVKYKNRNRTYSVKFVTTLLNFGWTHEQILKDIPSINNDDIEAVIEFNRV
jgi:hypothetical protein